MVTIIFVILAAFGLLCALWAGLGWLFSPRRALVMVYHGNRAEAALRCHGWLRGLGLVRGPLIIIGDALSPDQRRILEQYTEICMLSQIRDRLEQERDG